MSGQRRRRWLILNQHRVNISCLPHGMLTLAEDIFALTVRKYNVITGEWCNAVQRQKAVSAYFTSKQILSFVFAASVNPRICHHVQPTYWMSFDGFIISLTPNSCQINPFTASRRYNRFIICIIRGLTHNYWD